MSASLPPELRDVFTRYVSGPSLVRAAIDGSDQTTLNRPDAAGWSARNVLVHLADLEVAAAMNIRRLLAGDENEDVTLPVVDEQRWKQRLNYLWRDADAALALFQQLRFTNAELFQHADLKAWSRTAQRGGQTLTATHLLREGAEHAELHAVQLRTMLGPRS